MSTDMMTSLVLGSKTLWEDDPFLEENAAFDRLHEEYLKYGSLVIGYDFDSTVHDYHKLGVKHSAVIDLLRGLKNIGCKCICWTCYPDLTYVIKYCKDNDIPCDAINSDGLILPWASRKPFFSALLDDRAGLRQVYLDLLLLVNIIKVNEYDKDDESGDNRVSIPEQRSDLQPPQGIRGDAGIGIGIESVHPQANEG